MMSEPKAYLLQRRDSDLNNLTSSLRFYDPADEAGPHDVITPLAPVDHPRTYQDEVRAWVIEAFGEACYHDPIERVDRFVEEALELAQTVEGWDAERALALVDYVFNRPVGETGQEIGGVVVTLHALASSLSHLVYAEGAKELSRIQSPAVMAKIRAKQASKPVGSALPGQAPADKPQPVAAWERYAGDFNSMTDAEIDNELRIAETQLEEAESWIEAVAAWKAAGCPRRANATGATA